VRNGSNFANININSNSDSQKEPRKSFFSKVPSVYVGIPLALCAFVVLSFLLATITCLIRPGVTYERFDDTLTTQVTQEDLTGRLKKATGLLQKDEALLDAAADMTCGVFQQISSALVKNAAAPTLDMIQPVTPEDPLRRSGLEDQEVLNKRAQAKFEDTKATYMAKNCNQPLLDCFAGAEASAADAELRTAVQALDAQLNASKMKMKARGIRTTLGFTAPYVNEAVKAFSEGFYGSEGSTDCTATRLDGVSGPQLGGAELIAKGVALYNEAMKLHGDIQGLPQVAKLQRDALAAMNAAKDKLNNPSPEQVAHYKTEGTDPKYAS